MGEREGGRGGERVSVCVCGKGFVADKRVGGAPECVIDRSTTTMHTEQNRGEEEGVWR